MLGVRLKSSLIRSASLICVLSGADLETDEFIWPLPRFNWLDRAYFESIRQPSISDRRYETKFQTHMMVGSH